MVTAPRISKFSPSQIRPSAPTSTITGSANWTLIVSLTKGQLLRGIAVIVKSTPVTRSIGEGKYVGFSNVLLLNVPVPLEDQRMVA